MMSRRGFTMIEMMVALVMTGIVVGALYQLLVTNQRVYRQQTERVDLNSNMRAAVAIVPTEVRELNAADTVESDITAMGDSAMTYKAMRAFYVLCQAPVIAGPNGTLLAWRNTPLGLRQADMGRDSVLIFAEGDPLTERDNMWVHANVRAALTLGVGCPGGAPSVAIPVNNVWPTNGLRRVLTGAVVRSFETSQLLAYPDVNGDWWLGGRSFVKATGWSGIQPVLGPLSANGLKLAYFDAAGVVTAVPENVARIGVTVIGRSWTRSAGGSTSKFAVDTLVTHIALRNIPR